MCGDRLQVVPENMKHLVIPSTFWTGSVISGFYLVGWNKGDFEKILKISMSSSKFHAFFGSPYIGKKYEDLVVF